MEAAKSILSRPAPALPTTLRFFAAFTTSAVTFVALRTTRPSYSLIILINSDGVSLFYINSKTGVPKYFDAFSDMLSLTSMRICALSKTFEISTEMSNFKKDLLCPSQSASEFTGITHFFQHHLSRCYCCNNIKCITVTHMGYPEYLAF